MDDRNLGPWVGAFVDELACSGLRHVCVCPGSRSTPLALTFELHPSIKVWMHVDERSASFFALGMAKALGETVAVLATSGTAAGNFLPAIIEARYGRVPLLVLTADRPPELREVGAPQAIDQIRLYGDHVKWFVDMPLPETSNCATRYARTVADRGLSITRADPAGPVHLNCPFREPLLPATHSTPTLIVQPPLVHVHQSPRVCEHHVLQTLASQLGSLELGLIVCGPQNETGLAGAVADLGNRLGYPILADPLSQVRCGASASRVVSAYDAFLRDDPIVSSLSPQVVLRFGAMPTSKALSHYLQRHRGSRHILVDTAGWNDPTGTVTDIVHADPTVFCRSLTEFLSISRNSSWLESWHEIDAITRETMETYSAEIDEPFEGKVFAELADILPAGATLFAGNSMPVRDLDTFFPATGRPIRFLANRGANGIDGVVSTALGASAVGGPLILVIGDLSFYHDMNGLLAAKLHELDATIVLLNNDGGGIFSFLSQAGIPEFEKLFGTPHAIDFHPAVEMYGGTFRRVTAWPDFRALVREAFGASGLSVVEMPTNRDRNVTLHRELWKRVSIALEPLGSAAI